MNRIISVTGVDGDPQPGTWKVLLDDHARTVACGRSTVEWPDRFRKHPDGAVVGSTEGATINTAQLNLDSSGAYRCEPYRGNVTHHLCDRQLHFADGRTQQPDLDRHAARSSRRQPVGTIHIGANDGTVTRTEGMFNGRDDGPGRRLMMRMIRHQDDDADEDGNDENIVKRSIKRMFYQTRGRGAAHVLEVRRSFVDFFNRG